MSLAPQDFFPQIAEWVATLDDGGAHEVPLRVVELATSALSVGTCAPRDRSNRARERKQSISRNRTFGWSAITSLVLEVRGYGTGAAVSRPRSG